MTISFRAIASATGVFVICASGGAALAAQPHATQSVHGVVARPNAVVTGSVHNSVQKVAHAVQTPRSPLPRGNGHPNSTQVAPPQPVHPLLPEVQYFIHHLPAAS